MRGSRGRRGNPTDVRTAQGACRALAPPIDERSHGQEHLLGVQWLRGFESHPRLHVTRTSEFDWGSNPCLPMRGPGSRGIQRLQVADVNGAALPSFPSWTSAWSLMPAADGVRLRPPSLQPLASAQSSGLIIRFNCLRDGNAKRLTRQLLISRLTPGQTFRSGWGSNPCLPSQFCPPTTPVSSKRPQSHGDGRGTKTHTTVGCSGLLEVQTDTTTSIVGWNLHPDGHGPELVREGQVGESAEQRWKLPRPATPGRLACSAHAPPDGPFRPFGRSLRWSGWTDRAHSGDGKGRSCPARPQARSLLRSGRIRQALVERRSRNGVVPIRA